MVRGKYLICTDDLSDEGTVRRAVFGADGHEYDLSAQHVIVYDDAEKPVACGIVYCDGERFWIDRVGVLPDERGKEYGDFTARMLIDRAFMAGGDRVYVKADGDVVGFFEKLGFENCAEGSNVMALEKSRFTGKCGCKHCG